MDDNMADLMQPNMSSLVEPVNDHPYNSTGQDELYMSSKVVVTIYSILFVISSIGNTAVFISLLKNRNRKLRINLLILNLTIADLIVTYIMIPMEIGWRITNEWLAGDLMCRIMQAFR